MPAIRAWHPYRSKWEWEYAKYLDLLYAARRVIGWSYESRSFLIGFGGARYTPDFFVAYADGRTEWHEVKGFKREAAMVRIKAAALIHPDERFVLVTKVKGDWVHKPISPSLPTAAGGP